jgi:hypothetical protein
MAKFTTRVELINATWEDYETLHQEMANRNFTRTIVADDGVEYDLPPAEYNREGNYTRAQTLTAAKNAAAATLKGNRILVTESTGRIWYNLEIT